MKKQEMFEFMCSRGDFSGISSGEKKNLSQVP